MTWKPVLKKKPKGPPRLKQCPTEPNKRVYMYKKQAERERKKLYNKSGIIMRVYACPYKHIINKRGTRWTHYHITKGHHIDESWKV